MLDEGADHVEAPPAGLAEVSTEPLSSNATQAALEAHARLKIPPPFGSTSAAFHAAAPPVGFVEVRIRPAPSLPTHTPLDGHDWAKSSTGSSPGATSKGDTSPTRRSRRLPKSIPARRKCPRRTTRQLPPYRRMRPLCLRRDSPTPMSRRHR